MVGGIQHLRHHREVCRAPRSNGLQPTEVAGWLGGKIKWNDVPVVLCLAARPVVMGLADGVYSKKLHNLGLLHLGDSILEGQAWVLPKENLRLRINN